jgi:hypothetical protein
MSFDSWECAHCREKVTSSGIGGENCRTFFNWRGGVQRLAHNLLMNNDLGVTVDSPGTRWIISERLALSWLDRSCATLYPDPSHQTSQTCMMGKGRNSGWSCVTLEALKGFDLPTSDFGLTENRAHSQSPGGSA